MQYKYAAARRNTPGDDEEQQELKFPLAELEKKPYRHFEQTYTAQHAHFYISKTIGEAEHYVDMIYRISAAGPSDVIFIHLNTPGGHLDTGVQIINAIQNSQAKVVTVLEGVAYSLGTLIFLAGDEMVVNDHCMMMFHNFNSGLIGKGNELVAELEATVSWFNSLAKDIYIPFLTEEEYERIARGEDKWMQSPEIRTRLEKMVEKMNEEAAELQKAEQAIADAIEAAIAQSQKPTPAKKAPAKKAPAKKA
jgi:ATP-dependent Clp protease protease subunit